ncbi:MAG: FtsB family cell division protein [Limnochordia bacterium]|jgi:cell division protein FtsL
MVPARRIPNSYEWEWTNPDQPQGKNRRPQSKRRRRRLPATVKLCLIAVLLVSLGVLYISQQINTMYLSLQLAELQEEVNLAKQRNGYLRVQLEQARSIQAIEELARTRLGMVDPEETAVLVAANHESAYSGSGTRRGGQATAAPSNADNAWTMVANWLNKLFPVGGVEAGEL